MIEYSVHLVLIFMTGLLLGDLVYAAEQEEPAAAIVNGENIPISHLNRELQKVMMSNPALGTEENTEENTVVLQKMQQEILSYLIDRELIVQEGRKLGLDVQAAEVNGELEGIKENFPSQDAFVQALDQQGLTEKRLYGLIKRELTVRKVRTEEVNPTAKPITDADVAEFYEANKEKLVEPEKVSASHILIKVDADASDQERVVAKSKIQDVLKEARSGSDFAELAKKYSQCPSASQGGELGYFESGKMVEPFGKTAFSLQPGEISDIVETQFGYHIILLKDKEPRKQLKLEDVSKRIRQFLYDQEMDIALEKWLEPIREKASIKILFQKEER